MSDSFVNVAADIGHITAAWRPNLASVIVRFGLYVDAHLTLDIARGLRDELSAAITKAEAELSASGTPAPDCSLMQPQGGAE